MIWVLLLLVTLPFWLYMVLLDPGVQTYVSRMAGKQLEKITNSKVEIGHINFEPLRSLQLKKVYVSDQQNDTLFYIHELRASLNWIQTGDIIIWLDKVAIDSAKIYFREDSTGTLNFNYFLDALVSDTTTDTASTFNLKISDLNIQKTYFRLQTYNPGKQAFGVNYDDIFLKNIQFDARNFEMPDGNIYMDIDQMSLREQSGAEIDSLAGKLSVDTAGIQFQDFRFRVDSTYIHAKTHGLLFKNFDQMSEFMSEVELNADITQARIRMKDLAWFVPDFKDYDLNFSLKGHIQGPVSRIKGENVKISLTDSTYINTGFSVNGLPETEETFLYVNIHDLTAWRRDLKLIPMILNDSLEPPLPGEISRIGFQGNISGFFSDLITDGYLTSNVGNAQINLGYKQLKSKASKINGSLTARNVAIDQLTGDDQMFGKTSMSAKIEGIFKNNGNFQTTIKSDFSYLDFNQYRINDIEIDGNVTHEAFDGDIRVNDSALDMNFTGHFEYATEKLVNRFLVNIRKANLAALNFDTDSISTISCDLIANVEGLNVNNITGNLNILDLSFRRGQDSIQINEIAINSNQKKSYKKLNINSDFFNVDLFGHYHITALSPALSQLVAEYAPRFEWDTTQIGNNVNDFELAVDMINIQPLIKLFVPDVEISNNTTLTATYNRADNLLLVEGESEKLQVAGMKLDGLKIRTFNAPKRIHTNIQSRKFNYTNEYAIQNLSLSTIIQPDSVNLNLNWDNSTLNDSAIYSGNISSSIYYEATDSSAFENYTIKLDPSFVVISDTLWQIAQCQIRVDSTSYQFNQFSIENGFQYLKLQGTISENNADTLKIDASNVNISPLNFFTREMGIRLQGELSANMRISQVYTNPFIGSDIQLERLTINEQLIGDTKISTKWDPFLEMIHLEWISTILDTEVLNIIGDYDPDNSRMNFRLFIDRFNLNILEPYLEGILHDLKGLTTAEIILKGTIDKPKLQGVVIFDRTAFTLDYTQTRYEITDWFDIAPDAIYFNNVRITDKFDHYGHLKGKITHNNFDDIVLNLDFNSRNLMFLNTRREDNDLFYGRVFASGNTRITGSLDNMNVESTMQTDKNTKFFIPLESSEEVSQYDFIQFKYEENRLNRSSVALQSTEQEAEQDMTVNMNLNITPEAEVQIIFDSKIGDIIKSRGAADMNISMDKAGDISIFGDYVIEEGDYLFTLQDVFQKHLTIAKGSSLSWSGNPEEAILDIDAIYRVRRASIYDLTFNPNHKELAVPVETHLLMSGGLESPNIDFNLDLPPSAKEPQEQLNNLPQEDMNKQVLSLLVMNRFMPLPGAQTASNTDNFGMESNASELLSNQVSNWLSQMSGAFDVGFNYTPGDEVETQEYEVAVSTQLLNNRVTVQSNVGVGGQQVSSTSETENTSNIVGDFQVDVKLNRSGKLRLKGYAKSNEDIYSDAESTQGVGVFYKEEFNTFGELLRRLFGEKIKDDKE